jgi:hypothetical protein
MKRSETIAELAKALVKFNSKVSKISKDANNPFFKNNYATLDNIIDEVRPILTENGLSILQIPSGDGENVIMKTLLLHESGEFLESDELIMKPVKNDPQALGSAISYARRYSLNAFLSLNTGEDDDGNNASQPQKPKQQQQSKPPVSGDSNLISDAQKKKMNAQITQMEKKFNLTREQVIETLGKKEGVAPFEHVSNLTKGQASKCIEILTKSLEG